MAKAVIAKGLCLCGMLMGAAGAGYSLDIGADIDAKSGVFFHGENGAIFDSGGAEPLDFKVTAFGVPFLALDGAFRAAGFRVYAGVLSGIDIQSGEFTVTDNTLPNETEYRHHTVSRERLMLNAGLGYEFSLLDGKVTLAPAIGFLYTFLNLHGVNGTVNSVNGELDFTGTHWRYSETNLIPLISFAGSWRFSRSFSARLQAAVYPYVWAQNSIVDNYPNTYDIYLTYREGGNWGGKGLATLYFYPASLPYLAFFFAAEIEGVSLKDGTVQTQTLGYETPGPEKADGWRTEHSSLEGSLTLGMRLMIRNNKE
ncbi:MAG: hypothetical protein LBG87_03630 [Spirochaetaceae bacterium]|jgi:hypothetical protein|nr:hypothetical protein [Spirochaetaceae bacterium]